MNWFIEVLQKEARGRRFSKDDFVRYFTHGRKGKGKGIVMTPYFSKGRVVDYDPLNKRYKVTNNDGDEVDVHPRNLMPETLSQPVSEPMPEPVVGDV